MIKKILIVIAVLVVVPVVVYGLLVIYNNAGEQDVETASIRNSLEQSTQWLMANKATVLEKNNPMLWWMVQRAAQSTGDTRLQQLFASYKRRYIDSSYHNLWRTLFDPDYFAVFSPDQLGGLPDYNQYFIYGLTCNAALGKAAVIQRQTDVEFCRKHHPISPACVTHQMMGIQFRLQRDCGDAPALERQIRSLQDVVVSQLTWDPRVVDVYVQRVLMLVDTGAEERVDRRWLYRILRAQQADGSWSPLQPLVPLGGGRAFGFSASGVEIGAVRGSFHMTAQGLLLMSLLLHENAHLNQ